MKLKLMDMERFVQGLIPVTSIESRMRTGELNPEGLFSEKIFGIEGSLDRTRTYSYIDLYTKLIHPSMFTILKRLDQKLISMFSTDETFKIDSSGQLVQDDDGFTGIPAFIENFKKFKFRGETEARDELIKVLNQSEKDGTLFVDKLPVIPPEFRPEYEDERGRTITDEVNNIYVGLMRKTTQLSGIGSGPVFDVLVYGLQIALNAHDKYIKEKVSKKHGLIRNEILGKRVDFSGRAVIVPGPDIDINQIGLPLRLVVPLFEPFLIHYLLYSKNVQARQEFKMEAEQYLETSLSVESISRLFRSLKKGAVLPEKLKQLIFDAASLVMKDRVIIAKRDPVLHDGGYRAFYPILVRGNVIELCTLQVGPFNADFDGDAMGFFHPLSDQAQAEAKEKLTRLVGASSSDNVMFELSKEMVTGLYTMTKNVKRLQSPISVTEEDLMNATDPYISVKYRGHNTTMGRAIFNSAFPPSMPFVDTIVTKDVANGLVNETIKRFGENVTAQIYSKLEKIGFKFATIFGTSLTIDMFEVPDSIKELKKKIPNSSPEEVNQLEKQMITILKDHLKNTGMHDFLESGAGKGWAQPKQILIAKGMITDTKGNLLPPIEGSFSGGLTTTEYFHAAAGARKGMADRALNTADTGYFTRQLVYMLSPVEANDQLRDCKTRRTVNIKLNKDSIGRLQGRFILKGNSIVEFDKNDYKIGDTINLRTPIYCVSKKICLTCYGKLILRHKTPYIGILAGSKIGERGTQLIMRCCASSLIHYKNDLIQLVDLFEMGKNYRENNGIETVDFDDYIKGKNGPIKASTIQRHEPHDRMLFIKTKSGHSIICQANHPLWLKKNPIHSKYDNKYCRLIGDNTYTETMSTRKPFKTDHELKEVIASDVKKYDSIWIDNSDAINNKESIVPKISGYVSGIYCAEGCKIYNERDKKANFISQTTEGPIKERIHRECLSETFDKVSKTKQGVTCWENDRRLNDVILGSYAWEKRLRYDFINYDKEWLKEFISGLADGDGTVFNFNDTSTCIRIYTTSYYLTQQLHAICLKLGYKFNICKAQYSKKYNRTRLSFACDIKFLENPMLNSEKFKTVVFKPISLRKEKIIKGFDPIMTIREIEPDAWRYPVYDIKTETNEYLLGFVHNHNTFHTGGAATIAIADVLKDILDNDPLLSMTKDQLEKYLEQTDTIIYAKKPLRITVDLVGYKTNDNIQYPDSANSEHDGVWLNHLISQVEFTDLTFAMSLDYKVVLKGDYKKVGNSLVFEYYANEPVMIIPTNVVEIKEQVNYIKRLLGGKMVYKDPAHLLNKILKVYGAGVSDYDMVHFEVVVSQVLRDKGNTAIPARLAKTWNPVMANVKENVFSTSFLQGLAFENIGKAIQVGLIEKPEFDQPTIFEKLLSPEIG